MSTLNAILKEIKYVPAERLEELLQYVHSLTPETKKATDLKTKIMSYAGAFSDMSETDYADFLKYTRDSRSTLFDRKIEL